MVDDDREEFIAQEEAYIHFTLQEFLHMFKKDPSGVVKDLVNTFDMQICKDLVSRLNRVIKTAKVEQ